MTKTRKPLTVTLVDKLVDLGLNKLYSDAACPCLYLKTTKAKTGSWIFRWRDSETKKLKEMGLGSVKSEITLKEARRLTRHWHFIARQGIDPRLQRKKEKADRARSSKEATPLATVIDQYYNARIAPTGHTEKHKQRWTSMMRDHVIPKLGQTPIGEIETQHVEKVLEVLWITKLSTAMRVRQNLERVLDFAKVGNMRSGENPAKWEGNLQERFTSPTELRKLKPVKHHPAVPLNRAQDLSEALASEGSLIALAVEFTLLTAARSAEVREMEWSEIDLEEALWTVPAERMLKTNRIHKVPLSDRALEILKIVREQESQLPYVFSNPKRKKINDVSMTRMLKRFVPEGSIHGLRTTFKMWAQQQHNFLDEVSELALSHIGTDTTRAAYARNDLFEDRRRLLQSWSNHLADREHQVSTAA